MLPAIAAAVKLAVAEKHIVATASCCGESTPHDDDGEAYVKAASRYRVSPVYFSTQFNDIQSNDTQSNKDIP